MIMHRTMRTHYHYEDCRHRECDQLAPLTDALGPCSCFKPGFVIRCCRHLGGDLHSASPGTNNNDMPSAPNRAVTTPDDFAAPYFAASSSSSCNLI